MGHGQRTAALLALVTTAIILQGCVSASLTTQAGTRITPELIQAYTEQKVPPFLPYQPAEIDEITAYSDAARELYGFPSADEVTRQIIGGWSQPGSPEITSIRHSMARKKVNGEFVLFGIKAFVSLATLYMFPATLNDTHYSSVTVTMPDGTETVLTAEVNRDLVVTSLPFLFKRDFKIEQDGGYHYQVATLISHQEQALARLQKEQALLADIDTSNIDQLTSALRNPGIALLRHDIKIKLAQQLSQRRDRIAMYEKLVKEFPDFVEYIPGNERLFFTGPDDRRVLDIWRDLKKGTDPQLVAAGIRANGKPYRVFDSGETRWLQQQSIPTAVIVAMIDASAATRPAAPQAVTSATLVGTAATTTGQADASGNMVQACAKALMAYKACEQVPGDPLGITQRICVNQVKKRFGGMDCPAVF